MNQTKSLGFFNFYILSHMNGIQYFHTKVLVSRSQDVVLTVALMKDEIMPRCLRPQMQERWVKPFKSASVKQATEQQ